MHRLKPGRPDDEPFAPPAGSAVARVRSAARSHRRTRSADITAGEGPAHLLAHSAAGLRAKGGAPVRTEDDVEAVAERRASQRPALAAQAAPGSSRGSLRNFFAGGASMAAEVGASPPEDDDARDRAKRGVLDKLLRRGRATSFNAKSRDDLWSPADDESSSEPSPQASAAQLEPVGAAESTSPRPGRRVDATVPPASPRGRAVAMTNPQRVIDDLEDALMRVSDVLEAARAPLRELEAMAAVAQGSAAEADTLLVQLRTGLERKDVHTLGTYEGVAAQLAAEPLPSRLRGRADLDAVGDTLFHLERVVARARPTWSQWLPWLALAVGAVLAVLTKRG